MLSSRLAADDAANDTLQGNEGDDNFYVSVTDLNALNMGVDRRFS